MVTFAAMKLDSTTMFPPGTIIRSTGEPVLAQVVGHSEHGNAYCHITFDCDGKTVLHDRASVLAPLKCACMVVVRSPRGRVGNRHLVTVPGGWWETVFPGVGNDKGGGGYTGQVVPSLVAPYRSSLVSLDRKLYTVQHSKVLQPIQPWRTQTKSRLMTTKRMWTTHYNLPIGNVLIWISKLTIELTIQEEVVNQHLQFRSVPSHGDIAKAKTKEEKMEIKRNDEVDCLAKIAIGLPLLKYTPTHPPG